MKTLIIVGAAFVIGRLYQWWKNAAPFDTGAASAKLKATGGETKL